MHRRGRVVALLVGVAVVAVALWSFATLRMTEDVPDPTASSSPEEVVRTYLRAIDARDFETANRLIADPDQRLGRWDRPVRWSGLRDVRLIDEKAAMAGSGGQSTSDEYAQAWIVSFTGRSEGGDSSLPDEERGWGFIVGRQSDAEVWQIIDQGVG